MTEKMTEHKIYVKLKKENPEMPEVELVALTFLAEEKIKRAAAWLAVAISLTLFFLFSGLT